MFGLLPRARGYLPAVTTLLRSVTDAVGGVARMAARMAAIGVLVVAAWDDDDPVAHDPLLSD
jgi:hypothetical protein